MGKRLPFSHLHCTQGKCSLKTHACLKVEKKIWVGRLGKRRRQKRSTCERAVPFKGSFQVDLALSKRVFHSRAEKFYGVIS